MNNQNGQKGMSLLGFIIVLIFIVLVALLGFKLFPPYLDNQKIIEAMEKIAEDRGNAIKSKRQLVGAIDRILYTDFAHEVVDLNKALSLQRRDRATDLNVDYEVVVPIVYNISALLDFKNQVSIVRQR